MMCSQSTIKEQCERPATRTLRWRSQIREGWDMETTRSFCDLHAAAMEKVLKVQGTRFEESKL